VVARLLLVTAAILIAAALPSAQTDLDRLMSDVLARRDDNWKKLQQYTLREDNTFRLLGPGETPIFGSKRQYQWVPREGFFVRSPIEADGVTIGDAERKREEDRWLARERQREKNRAARRGQQQAEAQTDDSNVPEPSEVPDVLRQTVEPSFVSMAYFLDFKFETGHYALVGRERLLDRDVLRIEYYPEQLFRQNRRRERGNGGDGQQKPEKPDDRGAEITRQMNKVSLVTLWVEPKARQILQYEFQNIDADFLPGRWLVRIDEMKASMRMGNPFPDVWLPASVDIRVAMTLAVGRLSASYDVAYRDYRLAETGARVVP
jgi:hypothetical protein